MTQALKPPTLHNGNGLITYGLGGFSYYYSRTRMALSGTLIDHQQSLRVTEEEAYLTIQRQSRQRRKSMKEVAEAIVLSEDVKRGLAE